MCLTVPMKVEEVNGPRARCTALGQERWVDLSLMGEAPPEIGEYITVHLGFAQRVVGEKEALEAYELFGEIIEQLERETPRSRT